MCKANLLISGIFIFQRERKKKLMWFLTLAIGIFKSYFIYHIGVTNILVSKGRKGKMSEKELNLLLYQGRYKDGERNKCLREITHSDESLYLNNVCAVPLLLIPTLFFPYITSEII